MDHDADTVEYFALIAKCADATMANRPDHLTHRAYWRKLIQDRWHEVNSYMTTPLAEMAVNGSAGARDRLFSLIASLAYTAEMAAWWICASDEPGAYDPATVAQLFADEVKPLGKKTR